MDEKLNIPCKCYLCGRMITIWTSIVQWDEEQLKFKCSGECIKSNDEDLLWKTIRDNTDNEPIKWRVIAIDIDKRIICDFEWLDWEVFIIKKEHLLFKEPSDIIEINWKKFKEIID